MNSDKFNDFILQENQDPSVRGYLEQISSILNQLTPQSRRDQERISIIRQHLNEIRRLTRRLEAQTEKPEPQTPEVV